MFKNNSLQSADKPSLREQLRFCQYEDQHSNLLDNNIRKYKISNNDELKIAVVNEWHQATYYTKACRFNANHALGSCEYNGLSHRILKVAENQ